jgi:hypothetical protein
MLVLGEISFSRSSLDEAVKKAAQSGDVPLVNSEAEQLCVGTTDCRRSFLQIQGAVARMGVRARVGIRLGQLFPMGTAEGCEARSTPGSRFATYADSSIKGSC